MLKKMLFSNYNKLVNCKHKELYNLNITKEIFDLRKYLKEIELIDMNIDSLSVNLFIYTVLYMNYNIKEIILEMFEILKTDLEPEKELLVAGYMTEVINEIKKVNPILNNVRIIIPYGAFNIKDNVFLETLACFEK